MLIVLPQGDVTCVQNLMTTFDIVPVMHKSSLRVQTKTWYNGSMSMSHAHKNPRDQTLLARGDIFTLPHVFVSLCLFKNATTNRHVINYIM